MKECEYKKLEEKLEGLIVKAVQSGKKETSDLVADIIKRIEPSVEKSIEKYVNGKINRLDQKLSDYIKNDEEWKKAHMEANKELISSINLNTEFRLQSTGGLTLMKFLLGFVGFGTIISIILSIYK